MNDTLNNKIMKNEITWSKNIGYDGWSPTMENESAYDNSGGYISDSGNWEIYKRDLEETEYAWKRVGNWGVYRDEKLFGEFKTLKAAKNYVNNWVRINPQDK
tara:strand:+ start:245 stop:550 length:306 start_codon:yes stop_codon:yes gene_type:complete